MATPHDGSLSDPPPPPPPPPPPSLSALSPTFSTKLPELRAARRISDGGSKHFSSSTQAVSFATNRGTARKKNRGLDTYITCLIDDLRVALGALGASATNAQLEHWAILVHEFLSGDTRLFHSVHRVFEISAGCDPIQLLAALFRDAISSITDGGLSRRQEELVSGILLDGYFLTTNIDEEDACLQMVIDLFGLTPGQNVSRYMGLDVFLSAVAVTRVFVDTFTLTQLTLIVVCMEATIPFRPPVHGKTPLDVLYDRLEEAIDKYDLDISEKETIEAVQRAADLSNRNLGNFASRDAATFLDHTWSLLPERSAALRRSYLYTVNDFLFAARDMERFLTGLDMERVFQSFRGVPEQQEMETFHFNTQKNLALGRKYLRAKLLSVCIIAAFAVLTGGDAPMSFFCGDLPSPGSVQQSCRLGDSFPLSAKCHQDCDERVYEIMTTGRHREQVFDTRNDPLAAYIYAQLGDQGVSRILSRCTFPMTKVKSREMLRSLPKETVLLVGNDIGKLAVSRTHVIQNILQQIFENNTEGDPKKEKNRRSKLNQP